MKSAAVWELAFGLVVAIVMFAMAVGVRRTVSIGALLVLIPFQVIDTRFASSSVLMAYVLAAALLIGGGLRLRMLPAMSMIVLTYFASLALADRSMFIYHVVFMFQFLSCLVVFVLAYNFAILVKDEHRVTDVLLAINVLAIIYCALQLSVGPGERFIPFGIEQFEFNLNRDPSDPRLVGPFGNPGCTAGYFALMTLVCVLEIMFAVGRRRTIAWTIAGFNFMGLVATGNRAGFLVLVAMSPILLFAYRKELGVRRIVTLATGGAAVLAIAATIAVTYTDFNEMFSRIETVTETEGGVPATRADTWPVAVEKIKRHPWFGEGPHFWTAEDAEKIGQIQAGYGEGGEIETSFDNPPHSLYLYLLRTVGVFGLIAVVGFFIRTWFVLYCATSSELVASYRTVFVRLGLFLIPAFLISQITLEFNRPDTMDYGQFIFALMGLLVGMRDRAGLIAPKALFGDKAAIH